MLISMYLFITKPDGTKILYHILREVHLINNLKAHMLIGNNIVGPEQIVIDISKSKATINSCDVITDISYRQRSQQYTRRALHISKALSIPPRFEYFIPMSEFNNLPSKRDFLFKSI